MNKTYPAVLLLLVSLVVACGQSADPDADYPDGVPPIEPGTADAQPQTRSPGDESPEPDAGTDNADTHSAEGLVYTVPEGWSVGPARQMRVLTLDAGGGVEVAVAKWPGDVGGFESNLTRWLGQAGYNPADASAMDALRATFETIAVGDAEATWMPLLDGQGGSPMIALWVPRDGETWTFKITGDAETLRDKEDALRAWAESLSFE